MDLSLRKALLCLASSAALLTANVGQAAEELKLAHFVSTTHTLNSSIIDPLKQQVEARTNGELTIKVYPGGELGRGPMEQYVRALQGVADITWGLSGYTSSQFKKSMVVELPGVIPEGTSGYDMLWNAYDSELKSEFPGTKPLALWVSEPSVLIMKDKNISSPEDLKGLKIRVSGAMTGKLIEAYGATPVQMSAPEIYNALQTGLIDGVATGASAITDFKLGEVANSYTVGIPLGHIMFYLVMNQKKYDSLSDEQQAAIDASSGRALSQSGEVAWNERADKTLDGLRADPDSTVIDLTPEQIAPFSAISEPFVVENLKEIDGGQAVLDAMLKR
ncbi:TRAP transporter substrate-binding protein [Marinobacterium mangrovicola]|uniref:TRAP-type C4-dicarboxylate transport system substrate-binding protein n=1 Tax=Marinobacterium mangrovicola TaxID=1476959 RepID=A0A4R1GFT0_9GAMM|nr:TRAP transporter substrate-binding protein [Marinobacterium mangrovicola]TCK05763.1 TRAP-type C4-dicarboxylate transport system substrate-binding protein [Marinobacterium mangrovicola]